MALAELQSGSLLSVEDRARRSGGISAEPIYRCVARALQGRHPGGGSLVDVGCGQGLLWPFVSERFDQYIGIDVIRHEQFPALGTFHTLDLDAGAIPWSDPPADVVAAVEVIEHLENPRAFFRSLAPLVRSGGWLIVTTPNQLSFLSKLTLVCKNQFNAFQDSCYPAHLTALLESDLRRMAAECGLAEVAVLFSQQGRIPGCAWNFPRWLSRLWPRVFSDNILLIARKPDPFGAAKVA
jgi:2-polyprenyl-3-methyl-5-hydroxy-6-metoxy-1,4-benzoquinol methylase